eukprot:gene2429-3140_t
MILDEPIEIKWIEKEWKNIKSCNVGLLSMEENNNEYRIIIHSQQKYYKISESNKKEEIENDWKILKSNEEGKQSTCEIVLKAITIMLHYNPYLKEKEIKEEDFKDKTYFQLKETNLNFVKEYSPKVFLRIRELNNINQQSFIKSLCQKDSLISLGNHLGKSGSFLYITLDSKYILKTIQKQEKDIILSFLKPYYYYLEKNENTFIVKILSLFRIVNENLQDVHVIIMENVFPSKSNPHELYDLKGSTIGRSYKLKENNENVIYKDLDLKRKIKIKSPNNKKVIHQLMSDSVFLEEMEIIDYSLILGIYYEIKKEEENLEKNISFHSFKYIIEKGFENNYIPSFSTILNLSNENDELVSQFIQINQMEIIEILKNKSNTKENILNLYKLKMLNEKKKLQKEKRYPIRKDSTISKGVVTSSNTNEISSLSKGLVKLNIEKSFLDNLLKKKEEKKEIRRTYFVDKELLLEEIGQKEDKNLLQNIKLFKKRDLNQIIKFDFNDELPRIPFTSWKKTKNKNGYDGIGFSKLKETFHFGIIDITQRYTIKKKTGLFLSGFVYDKNELSSIDSKKYGERFRSFLQSILE